MQMSGFPPRMSNKTGVWNPTMEPVHNQNFTPTPKNQNLQRSDYHSWLNNIYLTTWTKTELKNIYNTPTITFNSQNFKTKVAITKLCTNGIYYRKISNGELSAITNSVKPFKKTFDYSNTTNYRYWMSSSLAKCRAFGNEAATDTDEVIIKLVFNCDLRDPAGFKVKAHQQPGVQSESAAVAIHREGFAEIGAINSSLQVIEILAKNFDHNLGFTRDHLDLLNTALESWEVVGD